MPPTHLSVYGDIKTDEREKSGRDCEGSPVTECPSRVLTDQCPISA